MNKIRMIFFTICMMLFMAGNTLAISESSPLSNINIHTYYITQLEVPASNSEQIKMAAVWFLPDFQASLSERSNTADGGGDTTKSCRHYGYVDSCSAPKVSSGTVRPLNHLTCQRSCICPSQYEYTSSNCDSSRGWLLGSSLCDGKSNQCNPVSCSDGFSAGTNDCTSQTHPEGWVFSSQGYSGGQICGKCNAKGCNSGLTAGLQNCAAQAQPGGWNYSSSGYAGNQICGKCMAKECPGDFTAGVTNCSGEGWNFSSNGFSGNQTCGKCNVKSCTSGYTAGLNDCNSKAHPEGWIYSNSGKSGDQLCGKCSMKSCPSGFIAALYNCAAYSVPAYWRYESNGYAGDGTCGKCTEKSCTEKNALCTGGSWNLDYYYADGALRCLMK